MGSGLGWLSKELLCSQKEAQGFAWKDLCPEFVGLVPKPYSPSTSTSTVFSRRSYLTTPVCMAHPSFELMCRVTSELSSLVCPHTSLSWRLPEGNQFLYEHQTININFDMNHHKRSPSDITWVDKTSHQMFVPPHSSCLGNSPEPLYCQDWGLLASLWAPPSFQNCGPTLPPQPKSCHWGFTVFSLLATLRVACLDPETLLVALEGHLFSCYRVILVPCAILLV